MRRRTPPEENIPRIVFKPFKRRAASAPPQTPAAQAAGPDAALETWIRGIREVMCLPEDKAFLAELQAHGVKVFAYDRIYFNNPYYDGKQWTTKEFEAVGTAGGTNISLVRSADAAEDASTLYHEGVHALQRAGMSEREGEYKAWVQEDRWRMAHHLPPSDPLFRSIGADGKEITDEVAVRAYVDKEYPDDTVKSTSGVVERITGKTDSGEVIVERSDGSKYTRAPEEGNTYWGGRSTVPAKGTPVDLSTFK
jgi:hypothetical protein